MRDAPHGRHPALCSPDDCCPRTRRPHLPPTRRATQHRPTAAPTRLGDAPPTSQNPGAEVLIASPETTSGRREWSQQSRNTRLGLAGLNSGAPFRAEVQFQFSSPACQPLLCENHEPRSGGRRSLRRLCPAATMIRNSELFQLVATSASAELISRRWYNAPNCLIAFPPRRPRATRRAVNAGYMIGSTQFEVA